MEVKVETKDTTSKICRFCLSFNRRLYPVLDNFFMTSDKENYGRDVKACWECVALMKKFKTFQTRVLHAKHILETQNEVSPNSLSQLGTKFNLDYDFTYYCEELFKDEFEEQQNDNGLEVFVEELELLPEQTDIEFPTADSKDAITEINYCRQMKLFVEEFKNASIPPQTPKYDDTKISNVKNSHRKKKDFGEFNKTQIEKPNTDPGVKTDKNSSRKIKKNVDDVAKIKVKFDHYECDVCSRIFKKRLHIWSHMRIHFPSYLCDTCGKSFTSSFALNVHILIHKPVEERPHACKLCSRRFNTKDKLVVHELFHNGEKLFKCDLCVRTFWLQTELNWHKKKKHGELKTERKKKYVRSISQYRHNPHRSNTQNSSDTKLAQDVNFSCNVCGKKFKQKIGLQQHSISHTNDRPHKCDICPSTFKFASGLWAHKLVHAGTKDHECSVCGAKFTLRSNLKGHMKIHTNDKPFSCHICDKRFPWNRNLRNHMKVHSK